VCSSDLGAITPVTRLSNTIDQGPDVK